MSLDYATDPLWADVQPIAQNDGPNSVVAIAYSEAFSQTMGYFRAILARGELSPRSLALTQDVIEQNSANYAAWSFRRQCLFACNSNLTEELSRVAIIARSSPKNYQLWHHRRSLIEKIVGSITPAEQSTSNQALLNATLNNEISFIESILPLDDKNYHAWSHRQWLVRTFPHLMEAELPLVNELLLIDVRNNSAWNHRMFVFETLSKKGVMNISSEIEWSLNHLDRAPHNESAWNFIRALLKHPECSPESRQSIISRALTYTQPIDEDNDTDNTHAQSLLIDAFKNSSKKGERDMARTLCEDLAERVDPVREKFWMYKASLIPQ